MNETKTDRPCDRGGKGRQLRVAGSSSLTRRRQCPPRWALGGCGEAERGNTFARRPVLGEHFRNKIFLPPKERRTSEGMRSNKPRRNYLQKILFKPQTTEKIGSESFPRQRWKQRGFSSPAVTRCAPGASDLRPTARAAGFSLQLVPRCPPSVFPAVLRHLLSSFSEKTSPKRSEALALDCSNFEE